MNVLQREACVMHAASSFGGLCQATMKMDF